ncbi:hypothetical protein QBC43DRAFT_360568 [Cladorrhinum sp. PSN259]|nr:hypothetical protein QBC43DRAFT_360568 [Cladorrhinum sp. PSN259]
MSRNTSAQNSAQAEAERSPWLYYTMAEFEMRTSERDAYMHVATSEKGTCVLCHDEFFRHELCGFHHCGALGCKECLKKYINASLDEYAPVRFPPAVPCDCPNQGDLLIPNIDCPVIWFLGARWALEFAEMFRNRVHNDRHWGTTEEIDEVWKAIADVVYDNGWRPCPICGQVVEHSGGCMDILCICGTRFCYICCYVSSPDWHCSCESA